MRTTTWLVIGSVLTLGLAAAFYLHWGEHNSTLLLGLAGLSAFSLPALVGLWVVAWRSGLPIMRLAALGTALVYLASFSSFGSIIGCGPDKVGQDAIVIYTHNVGGLTSETDSTETARQVAAEIVANGADIIVLQEVLTPFAQELALVDELAEYRFRATEPSDTINMLIWSRWPLAETSVGPLVASDVSRNALTTTVQSPQGPFALRNIHLNAPLSAPSIGVWQRQLERLAVEAKTHSSGPLILAGDFNATEDHTQFRRVLDAAFTDAHSVKGCGPDNTWPASKPLLPPVLRLDHVLVTDHFQVRELRIGNPAGSDHRPVISVLERRAN